MSLRFLGVRLSVFLLSDYRPDKYVGPGRPGASDALSPPRGTVATACHHHRGSAERLADLKGFILDQKHQQLSICFNRMHNRR